MHAGCRAGSEVGMEPDSVRIVAAKKTGVALLSSTQYLLHRTMMKKVECIHSQIYVTTMLDRLIHPLVCRTV